MPQQSGIRGFWRSLLAALAAACLLALASPGTAFAERFEVTSTGDDGNGDCDHGVCTLRDAVAEAGATSEPDTIVLGPETYRLRPEQLVLDNDITIEGAGSRVTRIEASGESRVAYVESDISVTVHDVTVAGGHAFGQEPEDRLGGAFRVASGGLLVLSRATVDGNLAAGMGGGISSRGDVHVIQSTISDNSAGDGQDPGGRGGGIHIDDNGTASLVNSTVSGNSAFPDLDNQPALGGGIYAEGALSTEHTTIAHNSATVGAGLYLADSSEMSMVNTLLAENREPIEDTSQSCAGAVANIQGHHNLSDDTTCALDAEGDREDAYAGLHGLEDHGGPTDTHALNSESWAIDAGSASQTPDCPAEDQRGFSRPVSGACDIGAVERRAEPVVNTFVDGDDGVCAPEPGDCTLREALDDSEPNAFIALDQGEYEVTLRALELRHNRMIFGQGARQTTIKASGAHRVLSVQDGGGSVSRVRITGGDVTDANGPGGTAGGGILVGENAALSVDNSAIEGNRAQVGGGIANRGHLVVSSSTIASNDAVLEGGAGGGILAGFWSTSILVNSTVSGNGATGVGGGIGNMGGYVEATNVTIAGNESLSEGGGVYGASFEDIEVTVGETELRNTIVADNIGGACAWELQHFRSATHSLDDDGSCFESDGGNLPETIPGIGELASTFGDTDVHPLLPGSAAVDAGDDAFCFQGFDQRGAPRVQGASCDIGAFEGVATTLRVVTQVVGGSARPDDFLVRLISGEDEVSSGSGSPTFHPQEGIYELRSSGPEGFVATFSDACGENGHVTVEAGDDLTCTLTLNHVPPPAGDACLSYPTFAAPAGLQLLRDAHVVEDVLHLNPDSGGLGAAWFSSRRPVADGFTTDFEFRIPQAGADGFAFVIQNEGTHALGRSGGGIGYQGVPNSLAVEFDTFPNFENADPGQNHVEVHSLGTAPNHASYHARLGMAPLPSFTDGQPHQVRIVYTPGTLRVFVGDMEQPALIADVNLASLLNLTDGAAFVGFTAATGGFFEGHHILSWSLCPPEPPPPPPDPATLRVVTEVVNDDGGTAEADDFSVHVRTGGSNVEGSPQPGAGGPEGHAYSLTPGDYTVSAENADGYSASFSEPCGATGDITLAADEEATCTITLDDVGPTLQLTTEVVNNSGGSADAGDFLVHVRGDEGEVDGSPAGLYALRRGTYVVSADAVAGYVVTISGDCDPADGSIALELGDDATCVITADDIPSTLRVVTQVVNDSGGVKRPGDFNVHVRRGDSDVPGSPRAGNGSGDAYSLAAGTYSVAADAVDGYALSVGGDCASDGTVTLPQAETRTCTVTADDVATQGSQPPPPPPDELPPPEAGEEVNAVPKSGTVRVRVAGTNRFVELEEGQQIPVGSVVDTTKGRVTIVAAGNQQADFYDGIFRLKQGKGAKPLTTLELVEKLSCPKAGSAVTSAKKKKKRKLWGDGSGKFRTDGEFSSATVRGTKWLVEDRCTSTLTKVTKGKVQVRDFVKRKNVLVRAGKQYVARARP